MSLTKSIAIAGFMLLNVLLENSVQADVKPAALFSDNMVMQQLSDAAIWGQADPGEHVTVSASWGQSATALADDTGEWFLRLKTPRAIPGDTQTYTLSFKGNNQVLVENVLVGEVWLASGQSNMEWTIGRLIDMVGLKREEVGDSDLPLIREYVVQHESVFVPADTMERWKIASGETIGEFSGTAWFFARKLHQSLDIPIGILNSSWGGKPIEAFLSTQAQETHAPTQARTAEMDQWFADFDPEENQKSHELAVAKWQENKEKAALLNVEFKQRKPRLMTEADQLTRYPGNLYKRMIQPLVPYNIKGTIWYQGEANSHTAEQARFYERQLTDLILSWRNDWQDAEMPFYVVQLASFHSPQLNPVEHEQYWPITRESMRRATDKLAHTGMAVAIDIGDAERIHPKNKKDVGGRLALLALHNDYGYDLVPSGPSFESFSIEGDSILLNFNHKGSGLVAKGDSKLKGFAIAGDDGKYVWAEAKIVTRSNGWKFWQKQELVEVSSPEVSAPKSVKYGWADNPDSINLYNKEGLPASPFSTD